MIKYWTKNRLVFDLLVPLALIIVLAFAFVLPIYNSVGEARLIQSIYQDDKLDFDIPSPSYAQINELETSDYVESVFPYYYTKTSFKSDTSTKDAHFLLSDSFDKIDQTMYCSARCIEKLESNVSNPLYVDYAFAQDLGVKLGDTVSIVLGASKIEFQVAAIYETNTYYDGGAVIAKWEGSQKDAITATSPNLSYSGAYINATDVVACKQYLNSNYKPMGRLKDASEFATEEAYQTHYNAFMSANYSNEITDFASKKSDINSKVAALESSARLSVILATVAMVAVVLVQDLVLWMRKSERGYFARKKTLGDSKITSYYVLSSLVQAIVLIVGTIAATIIASKVTEFYIPSATIDVYEFTLLGISVLVAILGTIANIVLSKKIRE